MSYTGVDFLSGALDDRQVFLDLWERFVEDGRGIVRLAEMDAVLAHVAGQEHDHDLCELATVHWAKDRIDWLP